MAIAFRCSNGNGSGATAQTSLVITKPTSPSAVQNGDTMYLFLSFAATTPTVTPAAGWTSIAGPTNAPSGSMRHQLFRKVASSEGSSWTFSLSSAAKWFAVVWVGSGIDSTTPNQTASITGMSGAAPFTSGTVSPNEQSWGVFFCGADNSAALTWNNGSQTRRFTGDSGSGTSHLNGAVADTAGIVTSGQSCAWTPSPLSLQGGAMVALTINDTPVTPSADAASTATGAANSATTTLAELAPANAASATMAAANDATVTLAEQAPANASAATVAAYDATVSFATSANANTASATTTANDVVPVTSFATDVAQVSTTANDATILTGAAAPADVATVTALAGDATGSLGASPTVATGTTTANDTTLTLASSPTADVATVTSASNAATVTTTIPIAYFGSGTGTASGANTIAISTPASIPAGAAMILSVGGFCTSATPTPSGSGWTLVDASATGSASFWTWVKIASGGEGTITVTMDGSNQLFGTGGVSVYTGVDAGSPIVSHGVASWSGVSHGTVTSPSVNNTGTSSDCAVFVGAFYNGSTGHGQSTPTNMSISYDYGDGTEGSAFGFYRLNAPTGAQTYSTTATGGQIDWYGGNSLLFLAPAVGVNANADAAATTTEANDATLTLTSSPTSDSAAASAAGQDSIAGLGTSASVASTATAAASDGTAGLGAVADVPQPTAAAYDATTTLAASPGAGAATASADGQDATTQLAESAAADAAALSATAYDATASLTSDGTGHADIADVQPVAQDATADVKVAPDSTPGTTTAYDATVSVMLVADAPADAAVVTTDAFDASVDMEALPRLALVRAEGVSLSNAETADPGAADALDASVAIGVAADAATETTSAFDAIADAPFPVGVALVTTSAITAAVSRNVTVDADLATVTAQAYGALGAGFNVTATDNYTYNVPSESRIEEIERESRTYTPEGDWTGIASILV